MDDEFVTAVQSIATSFVVLHGCALVLTALLAWLLYYRILAERDFLVRRRRREQRDVEWKLRIIRRYRSGRDQHVRIRKKWRVTLPVRFSRRLSR